MKAKILAWAVVIFLPPCAVGLLVLWSGRGFWPAFGFMFGAEAVVAALGWSINKILDEIK